jgi:hypothetical protein
LACRYSSATSYYRLGYGSSTPQGLDEDGLATIQVLRRANSI